QPFTAQLDAAAGEHANAQVTGTLPDLLDESGLADARLAGDEHHGRAPVRSAFDCCRHVVELGSTAHERQARDPFGHDPFCRYPSSVRPTCACATTRATTDPRIADDAPYP